MEQQDLERIARHALRELGALTGAIRISPAAGQADRWRIVVDGPMPLDLTVKAGRGTSPQHVRDQIFEQVQR